MFVFVGLPVAMLTLAEVQRTFLEVLGRVLC